MIEQNKHAFMSKYQISTPKINIFVFYFKDMKFYKIIKKMYGNLLDLYQIYIQSNKLNLLQTTIISIETDIYYLY